mmetsp:Transcript_31039/g.54492  ORF Transcript_31039/g.54492 Transcript_31039/m.54492 type:complete len:211 (+) Transcript_31039:308-940(+)
MSAIFTFAFAPYHVLVYNPQLQTSHDCSLFGNGVLWVECHHILRSLTIIVRHRYVHSSIEKEGSSGGLAVACCVVKWAIALAVQSSEVGSIVDENLCNLGMASSTRPVNRRTHLTVAKVHILTYIAQILGSLCIAITCSIEQCFDFRSRSDCWGGSGVGGGGGVRRVRRDLGDLLLVETDLFHFCVELLEERGVGHGLLHGFRSAVFDFL